MESNLKDVATAALRICHQQGSQVGPGLRRTPTACRNSFYTLCTELNLELQSAHSQAGVHAARECVHEPSDLNSSVDSDCKDSSSKA
jgi:hypothetical protein